MFGESLTIRLAPRDLAALHEMAAQDGVGIDHILRGLIAREIKRAKKRRRADERLVARLQRLLAPTMAEATDWPDLQDCLRAAGFELRPDGGGLTLHRLPTGDRLCKSCAIGFAYSRSSGASAPRCQAIRTTCVISSGPAAPEEVEADFDLIGEI